MAKTLEERLDWLFEKKKEISAVNEQKAALQKEYDEEEYLVCEIMAEQGIRSLGIDKCSATFKVEKYPRVEDIESFVTWCAENNLGNMLQKRVSKAVFDEYFNDTGEYPTGIDVYDKSSLLIRKR